MPAACSRCSPPSAATVTIAESPGGSPSRARSALARATSCRWIAAIPTSVSSSSAGTVPAQASRVDPNNKCTFHLQKPSMNFARASHVQGTIDSPTIESGRVRSSLYTHREQLFRSGSGCRDDRKILGEQ
jgi:hypothetical protein